MLVALLLFVKVMFPSFLGWVWFEHIAPAWSKRKRRNHV